MAALFDWTYTTRREKPTIARSALHREAILGVQVVFDRILMWLRVNALGTSTAIRDAENNVACDGIIPGWCLRSV